MKALTTKHLDAFGDATIGVLKKAIDPLKTELASLRQRVAELEGKPHVKFCGVWKAGTTYTSGDAVTHHGALWIAKGRTTGEPGKDYASWQLAVKRGDAR